MTDVDKCRGLAPTFSTPRMVAGGPLTNDAIECQLKPLDTADYAQPLNDAQLERLAAAFPTGVCD